MMTGVTTYKDLSRITEENSWRGPTDRQIQSDRRCHSRAQRQDTEHWGVATSALSCSNSRLAAKQDHSLEVRTEIYRVSSLMLALRNIT